MLILIADRRIRFKYLCICTGVRPNLIADHPLILPLRDLHSVNVLKKRLESSKKIAVIGNGGIALELVHEVERTTIVYIYYYSYIMYVAVCVGLGVGGERELRGCGIL
jgi:hypothetical protein